MVLNERAIIAKSGSRGSLIRTLRFPALIRAAVTNGVQGFRNSTGQPPTNDSSTHGCQDDANDEGIAHGCQCAIEFDQRGNADECGVGCGNDLDWYCSEQKRLVGNHGSLTGRSALTDRRLECFWNIRFRYTYTRNQPLGPNLKQCL